jgi:carboxyl-terminal processing protease
MSEKKYSVIFAFLILILVILSYLVGYFSYKVINRTEGEFPVLFQAYELLRENFIGEMPLKSKMEFEMIRGMVNSTKDPYTSFYEPPQAELQSNTLEGKYGGIGTRLERLSDNKVYLFPYVDSPAALAGIKEGDELIQVDKLVVLPEISLDEIQAAIRGPVGERVNITTQRQDETTTSTFDIERKEYGIPSVTWNIYPPDKRVGIIHVNVIASTTAKEIENAINDLKSKEATYFILDLRNNSGGLVDSGIEISRLFLSEGVIIQQQYKNKPVESYDVISPGPYSEIPLIVLVNHNTASAAEIVAGSLQGKNRALLVGTKSYGKFSIQLVFELIDKSSIHITSARWWIPSLSYKSDTLIPDIELSDEIANSDLIYEDAIHALIK